MGCKKSKISIISNDIENKIENVRREYYLVKNLHLGIEQTESILNEIIQKKNLNRETSEIKSKVLKIPFSDE